MMGDGSGSGAAMEGWHEVGEPEVKEQLQLSEITRLCLPVMKLDFCGCPTLGWEKVI